MEIRGATRPRLERRLPEVDQLISERDAKRRSVPALVQKLSEYNRADGSVVPGRINPELLSFERLQKSVEDGEKWLADLERKAREAKA